MPKAHKLALMMIVKNESSIIGETIDLICKHFSPDYWVISDTGSTDDTKDVITKKMSEKKINGHFADLEWKDFSTNRNHVLNEAMKYADYLLTFDADDGIQGELVMPPLEADKYDLCIQLGGVSYYRPFIFSTRRQWKWYGVLHEYISCEDGDYKTNTVEGNYYIQANRVPGARSSQDQKTKYSKDGDVLAAAIEDPNTPTHLIPRYTYYAGQSYKDAGIMEKAVSFFEQATKLNGWTEEKYRAAMDLARHFKTRGESIIALTWYGKAGEFSPSRVEWAMESATILESVANIYALGVLMSIHPDKIAHHMSVKYFGIDIRTHNVYFFNRVIQLAAKCKRHDVAPPYLEAQAKRVKWLTDADLSCLYSNIKYFSSVCGEEALRGAREALSNHAKTAPSQSYVGLLHHYRK